MKYYFYIIKNIRTGIYYAGSKYGKYSDPNLFWKDNGYFTSSKIIKKIIEKEGKDIFSTEKIKLFKTPIEAWNYETKFLIKVNAAKNKKFYNVHNNINGSLYFSKEQFQKIFNVDNPSQLEFVKKKKIETYKINYGDYSYSQSPDSINKRMNTCIERYGVKYITQSELHKKLVKNANIEKYGINYGSYFFKVARETYKNNTGYNHQLQNPEVKNKIKNTCIERYGVDNPAKSSLIKEKTKQTNIEKYGYTSSLLSLSNIICEYCNKSSNPGNYKRWHGLNCKNRTIALDS